MPGVRPIPRVPADSFARPRLFARLDAWPDITVVTGPFGSGKTTLIASWLQTREDRSLWCTPDLSGYLPMNEISSFAAAGPGILVIDHAERLRASQCESLGHVINASPQLQVVLASRRAHTAVDIAPWCEAGIKLMTAADLLITETEIRHASPGLPDEAYAALLSRSAGLALAVKSALETPQHTGAILREQVRHRLRTELEAILGDYRTAVRLALVPQLNRRVLLAWRLSPRLLDRLCEGGVAAGEGEWVRIHPFIREILREDADRYLSDHTQRKDIADALHASLIAEAPLVALELALTSDQIELANEVALSRMVELLETRVDSLAVLSKVPLSRVRGYPAIIILLIMLNYAHPDTRPRAMQLMAREALLQRVKPSRSSHRERVVYRAFEAAAMRLMPFSGDALATLRRAYADFAALSDADFESLNRLGPMIYVHLGVSAFYLRDVSLARECFELADAEHASAGRADRVDPLSMRAGLAALNGEVPLARRLIAASESLPWPMNWRETNVADFLNLARAIIALDDGDLAAVSQHLHARAQVEELSEHWRLFALVSARRDVHAEEAELGLLRLRQLRDLRGKQQSTPLDRSFLDAAEAELLLAVGKLESARKIAARSAKHGSLARNLLARIELALDRPAAAAIQATRVIESSTAPRHLLEAELVLTCCALRSGEMSEAHLSANRVVEMMRISTLKAPMASIPPQDRLGVSEFLRSLGVTESELQSSALHSPAPGLADPVPPKLTPRETTVLRMLERTGSVDEIAAELFISRNTVKSQLRSVYRKLDVSSRDAALTKAALLGLLTQQLEEQPQAS